MLLGNIMMDSLCYTVAPWWLSILNIAVLKCQYKTPNLPLFSPGNHKFVLCESVSVLQISSFVLFFNCLSSHMYHMIFVFDLFCLVW